MVKKAKTKKVTAKKKVVVKKVAVKKVEPVVEVALTPEPAPAKKDAGYYSTKRKARGWT